MATARARALEKKGVLEAERAAKAQADIEKQEAADWSRGAKDNSKKKAQEDKELEKLKKKQELAALTQADEMEAAAGPKVSIAKPKKKKKDDCDLLLASLAAMPKTKAEKQKEAAAKEAADRKAKAEKAAEIKAAKQEAEKKRLASIAAKGIVIDDDLMSTPNTNRQEVPDFDDSSFVHEATGLEGAISVLNFATGAAPASGTPKPEGNRKALYEKFFEKTLPGLKEDYPNLKLSQYKERVFDLWKNSPENPANFVGADGSLSSTASSSLHKNAATAAGIARANSRSSLNMSTSPVPTRASSSTSASGSSAGGCALAGAGSGIDS